MSSTVRTSAVPYPRPCLSDETNSDCISYISLSFSVLPNASIIMAPIFSSASLALYRRERELQLYRLPWRWRTFLASAEGMLLMSFCSITTIRGSVMLSGELLHGEGVISEDSV